MPDSRSAIYGPTNPDPKNPAAVMRFGSVIGLNPDKEAYYRSLHADVWPEVLSRLKQSGFRNYSIYVTEIEGKKYLFSYCEYTGHDLAADKAAIANDPDTQRWWQETDPCQFQLPGRKEGENWSDMERVFFME